MSRLIPLRVACSGGHFPLAPEAVLDDGYDDDDVEAGSDAEERPRKKRMQKYSDFAFTSKCMGLLKELEKIRDSEPESKSLVFSQYKSTLDWLQIELPKHGFQFRTLSGGMSMTQRTKAMDAFQNDPPTTIFLLSLRAGAVGINLTTANRVFLMEPATNPALEEQAIGRVCRLGQKSVVEIVRLVVKNSIETRLRTLLDEKYGNANTISGDCTRQKCATLVGSLTTDKTTLLTGEFDSLFDVEPQAEDNPNYVLPTDSIEVARPENVITGSL